MQLLNSEDNRKIAQDKVALRVLAHDIPMVMYIF